MRKQRAALRDVSIDWEIRPPLRRADPGRIIFPGAVVPECVHGRVFGLRGGQWRIRSPHRRGCDDGRSDQLLRRQRLPWYIPWHLPRWSWLSGKGPKRRKLIGSSFSAPDS